MTVHIEKIQNGYIVTEDGGPRIFVRNLVYAVAELAASIGDTRAVKYFFWDSNNQDMSGILIGENNEN